MVSRAGSSKKGRMLPATAVKIQQIDRWRELALALGIVIYFGHGSVGSEIKLLLS